MKAAWVFVAACWLGGGSAALACTPVAFGKFKVGQKVAQARFAGIAGTCSPPGECTYNERSGIEYVVSQDTVVEVSAPVRLVRGLPTPPARMDAAYARRASAGRCQAFALKRDDGGDAYLESAERVDPVSKEPVRVTIHRDERGTPVVAITSLPDN